MSFQAGWYADPTGRFEHRYYDGTSWTEHVARDGNQAVDALDQPAAPGATGRANGGGASPAVTPGPAGGSDTAAADPPKGSSETVVVSGSGPFPEADPAAPATTPTPAAAPVPPSPAAPLPPLAGGAPRPPGLAPQPGATPGGPVPVDEKTAKRRKVMSWLMLSCGAVVFLAAFLPWIEVSAFGVTESESGFSEAEGKITALMGIGLGVYALQGLIPSRPRVQFHPVVVAVIVVTVGAAGRYYNRLDEGAEAVGLETGDLLGIGLILTIFAGLLAIWPLVILWRDDRRQLAQQPALAANAPAAAAPGQAPPAPAPPPSDRAPLAPPADRQPAWQPDPTGRFELRYFDGSRWTEHVTRAGQQSVDPV